MNELIRQCLTKVGVSPLPASDAEPIRTPPLDSLTNLMLLTELERVLKIKFPVETLTPADFRTINALTDMVSRTHEGTQKAKAKKVTRAPAKRPSKAPAKRRTAKR